MNISGILRNVGDAGIKPDSTVRIKLDFDPTHFSLTSEDSIYRRLNLAEKIKSFNWELTTSDTASTRSYSFMVSIDDTVAYDQNKYPMDTLVVVQDSVISNVTVLEQGNVRVDSILIVSPVGAMDSILSTDQEFTIQANVHFIGSISASGRKAELELGAGFSPLSSLSQNTFKRLSMILEKVLKASDELS